MRRSLIVTAIAAALIAACGGQSPSSNTSAGSGATVKTMSTKLGTILATGQGQTLYLFEKDMGSTSECTGTCATAWPPLLTQGRPQAGSGVNASKLGTTSRADGTTQVTYNGHPLYMFHMDAGASGSVKGEGLDKFGAEWYALNPAGQKVEEAGS